jgi:tRNA (cytidine/uridine-2'-O-)-methyltransferase
VGRPAFRLDEKSLRRAGLDYWEWVDLHQHAELVNLERSMQAQGVQIYCFSAHASEAYTRISFRPGDCLLFGAETRGLPPEVLQRHAPRCFTIPMLSGKVRSLNLATSVGIVLYEGLRQLHGW